MSRMPGAPPSTQPRPSHVVSEAEHDPYTNTEHQDGTLLAAVSGDRVRLWSVQAGQDSAGASASASAAAAARSGPGGVVVGSAGGLNASVSSEQQVTTAGGNSAVNSRVLRPDGQLAASAEWDSTVRLWSEHPLRLLASVSRDLQVRVWSVLSNYRTLGHTCVFSSDGDLLAAELDWDNMVQLAPPQQIDVGRAARYAVLSHAEFESQQREIKRLCFELQRLQIMQQQQLQYAGGEESLADLQINELLGVLRTLEQRPNPYGKLDDERVLLEETNQNLLAELKRNRDIIEALKTQKRNEAGGAPASKRPNTAPSLPAGVAPPVPASSSAAHGAAAGSASSSAAGSAAAPVTTVSRGDVRYTISEDNVGTPGARGPREILAPDLTNPVQVLVRVRPLQSHEVGDATCVRQLDEHTLQVTQGADGGRSNPEFRFQYVSGPGESQEGVFERVRVFGEAFVEGITGVIFAYGQTGSGKTHTIHGDAAQKGVVPRMLDYIFERLKLKQTESAGYDSISISCMELYNEDLRDLIGSGQNLQIHGSMENLRIVGLSKVSVTSAASAYDYIRQAVQRRETDAHQLNKQSSRSHMITTLYLDANPNVNLHLVDLAGSERISKSGVVGQRRDEAIHINQSLLVLGRCIHTLAHGQRFLHFRDSNLTRLLQRSLVLNGKICMIATVTPSAAQTVETMNTLMMAQTMTKYNKEKAKPDVVISVKQLLQELQERDARILELEQMLSSASTQQHAASNEQLEELARRNEELQRNNEAITKRLQMRDEQAHDSESRRAHELQELNADLAMQNRQLMTELRRTTQAADGALAQLRHAQHAISTSEALRVPAFLFRGTYRKRTANGVKSSHKRTFVGVDNAGSRMLWWSEPIDEDERVGEVKRFLVHPDGDATLIDMHVQTNARLRRIVVELDSAAQLDTWRQLDPTMSPTRSPQGNRSGVAEGLLPDDLAAAIVGELNAPAGAGMLSSRTQSVSSRTETNVSPARSTDTRATPLSMQGAPASAAAAAAAVAVAVAYSTFGQAPVDEPPRVVPAAPASDALLGPPPPPPLVDSFTAARESSRSSDGVLDVSGIGLNRSSMSGSGVAGQSGVASAAAPQRPSTVPAAPAAPPNVGSPDSGSWNGGGGFSPLSQEGYGVPMDPPAAQTVDAPLDATPWSPAPLGEPETRRVLRQASGVVRRAAGSVSTSSSRASLDAPGSAPPAATPVAPPLAAQGATATVAPTGSSGIMTRPRASTMPGRR